jgi:hypothetical protein
MNVVARARRQLSVVTGVSDSPLSIFDFRFSVFGKGEEGGENGKKMLF